MTPLGPMVVVAESSVADVTDALGKAGAFPIVEASWTDAGAAIAEIKPAALMIADPEPPSDVRLVQALVRRIDASSPIMPVIARVREAGAIALPSALPIAVDDSMTRLVGRLRSALRIRTLHAAVLRRAGAGTPAERKNAFPPSDLLDHATVLCLGRGGSYPTLSVAIGEQVGLIGAFSVETAARYLNARDIEGVVIGDGFGPRVVEALLTALADDARFRDLPVGVLGVGEHEVADDKLPNLVRVGRDPVRLVELLLPFVRLHAFEAHLRRVLESLTTDGVVDPQTGLLSRDAFWRDLDRAVQDAENGGGCLSLARFAFEDTTDRRTSIDAARLLSRLVRDIDFACRQRDGSILVAFTETDLRSAHVVARRLAGVLRQTMLSPDRDQRAIKPTITLATLKPTDNVSTLAERVGTRAQVAAG